MPGKVKVKIVAGRNLPVMDRSSDTTDAYVEVKLGNTTFKTDVCRKSLNPQWNSEWYRFEMDDAELQDEPLQIRLMDHDTYSANDAIGKVYLDLNPLLLPSAGTSTKNVLSDNCPASTNSLSGGNTMSGWFPVYDTMHGIRGEVNVIVKVELFSDFNKFRQSSCGVQFFNSPSIPHGYHAQIVHGMVEELVVSDDPEYQWIDKIRTPRASNEARQTLFFKLSGEVQRRIGLKVLDIGGNAVIGYLQCFDLEAECGIVVRGLGTAVSLVRIQEPSHMLPCQYAEDVIPASPLRGSPPKSKHLKGFLAPGNPRNRRSKSPQIKQPFAEYKPKRLGTYTRSFSDNVPECDNVSLKVLFEQEDMRGEPVSSRRQKLFERLSSFPKRKLRAFQARSRNALSSKMPYVRSKSENVASSLIRSIMDPGTFSLDRVPEGEELVDKLSDTDSVIHPLRYDDGHLVPISSSSSDTSSSDIEDISDDSSISTSTQEYGKIESMKCKKSKLIALNNISTSFDTSVTSSKNDDELSEKEEQDIVKQLEIGEFTSSVHIVMSPNNDICDHNQFSSSVKFKDSPSPPKEMKSVVSTLKRQASFDMYSNLRKRSDTPPLSEMDPYMKELSLGMISTKKFLVSQPSLDEQLKTLPITNLSFPESVRNLPSIKSGHIANQNLCTVHTIDVCDRSNLSEKHVSNLACIKPSINLFSSLEASMAISQISCDEDNNINTCFSMKESPKTNDTIDKIINNPFKFPADIHTDISVADIPEYHVPVSLTHDTNEMSTTVPLFTSVGMEVNPTFDSSYDKKSSEKYGDDKMIDESFETPSTDEVTLLKSIDILQNIAAFNLKDLNETAITNTDNDTLEINDSPPSNTDLSDHTEDDITCGRQVEERSFPFKKASVDVEEKSNDGTVIVGEEVVPCALAVVVVESENTNRVTCNLSPPVHPLVKSLSASGLVEPAHSSVPPSRTVPEESAPGLQPVSTKASQSPIKLPGIHRRSSDSDLSITPKGNSLTSSGDRSSVAGSTTRAFQNISAKLAMKKEPIEAMEFPFLTMNKFPPGFIVHIAGTVASRSVKLLERVSNQEEPESRDTWWTELRMEVRSHMRALSANALIGYSETTTICDDVCVLSASGTAAVVNVRAPTNPPVSDTPEPPATNLPPKLLSNMTTSLDRTEFERQGPLTQSTPLKPDTGGGGVGGGGGKVRHHSESTEQPEPVNCACSVCHLPFNPSTVPLSMTAIKCGVCGKRKVPDLLLATIEPLEGLSVIGRSCLIHVFVTRPKQHARGEMNACVVSDSLPFIEYDIYKQLVNKLKVNGMNAVFGLKTQICLGERMIAAVTSGTAMYLEALPPPSTPTITPGEAWNEDSKLSAVLKGLQETVKKNRDFYQVRTAGSTSQDTDKDNSTGGGGSDTEESDDELPDIDLHAGNKEACVFMVDDEQDIEVVSQLIDPHPPEGFFVTSTEGLPGMDELEMVRNLQMFTQIWRSRIPSSQPTSSMHKHFHKLLQGIYYKLRRMTPCAVGNIKFRLALPEPDEMQISIVGMAVGLGEGLRNVKSVRRRTVGASSKPDSVKKSDDGDMIFSLEEDQESSNNQVSKTPRPKSPMRPTRQSTHLPPKERYGVDITPLSYIPGGRIERYLGNLNFFFIRETSCIREGGGLSGFVHSFVAEVLAIIRAHVTALGGNAMVAFFLNECIILNNPHKNHGQCLINVGGDAVSVSYLD